MSEGKRLVSRRSLLKGGLALVASTALARFARVLQAAPALLQTAPKRIYIAPDDHTDYMWEADESTYRQAFLDMIDYYLNLADTTANQPADYQSRWHCDGSFWLWTYERYKSSGFGRLIQRIRDGHISAPLNPLCQCLGGAPAEAVLRGMYYPGRLERNYGLRFYLAYSMENQTLPYGLGALWAGAGAKYSWKGICGCASQVPSAWDRQYDIYWWVGADGSRILMKWNSMLQGNQSMGGYAEAYSPSSVVDYVDANSNFKSRYSYDVIGAFGRGWDGLEIKTDEFPKVAKNKTTSQPPRRVIVSNELDFFQDFEAAHGAELPSLSCSFGNEWDLYCTSMAEVSARVKRAVEKLRSAEALATLVSLRARDFMDSRIAARDLAWMDLGLYWEHDWTADGPVGSSARANWQRKLASEIESYVNSLYANAASALAGMIQKSGSNPRFYAFNPLGWTRTDIADVPYSGSSSIHVVDLTTGQDVPSQIVTVDGVRYLRILAGGVPPVGYKVFEIRSGSGQGFSNAATVSSGVIESGTYKITVASRGAITSLIDKTRSNQEFAQAIGGRTINDLGSGSGTLQAENVGPVSATLLATMTTSSPLKHTSRITLIRGSNRIDIRNDVNQNFGYTDPAYTWSFAFKLTSPDVWHEEVGAVIRARLTTAGGHYSPRNARYDWLTLNHFADVSGSEGGVTLSNADCYFMRLGNSTAGALDTATPQLSPLVGGQVDGSTRGIPNQGGDTHFMQRFALQTRSAYDPVAAMKFALEHQNPLATGMITGGSQYPDKSYSLLSIDNQNVLLWALKPAEDGIVVRGIIARLWNLSGSQANFSLSLSPGPILSARRTTHIETPLGNATVSNGHLAASLAARQMGTFSVTTFPPLDEGVYLPLILKQ